MQESDIKQMAPPEGKALIYIIRVKMIGAAVKMGVLIDGVKIGDTRAKNFLYVIAEPGPHEIMSKAENKFKMELTLQPNTIYFIEQQVKMGFAFARTKLVLIDEKKGRKFLGKCKLSKFQL